MVTALINNTVYNNRWTVIVFTGRYATVFFIRPVSTVIASITDPSSLDTLTVSALKPVRRTGWSCIQQTQSQSRIRYVIITHHEEWNSFVQFSCPAIEQMRRVHMQNMQLRNRPVVIPYQAAGRHRQTHWHSDVNIISTAYVTYSYSGHLVSVVRSRNCHAIATKNWEFWHKISHNSANIRHRAMDVAQDGLIGGFRGQTIYWCDWNLHQIDPGCHGKENLGILTQNRLELG